MNKIKSIYYDFITSNEYSVCQEVDNTLNEASELLNKLERNNNKESRNEVLDACVSYGSECEFQGFKNGFKYAMSLMQECL